MINTNLKIVPEMKGYLPVDVQCEENSKSRKTPKDASSMSLQSSSLSLGDKKDKKKERKDARRYVAQLSHHLLPRHTRGSWTGKVPRGPSGWRGRGWPHRRHTRRRSSGPTIAAAAGGLVHLDRVDQPVRLGERLRIRGDVIGALWREGHALAVLLPHLAGPVAAQGNVENEVLLLEVARNVAPGPAVELGDRLAPRRGVRVPGRHVGGDGGAREEPDGDGLRVEVDGVDAAADGVEPVAVVLVAGSGLAAAGEGRVGVAVLLLEGGGGVGAVVGDGAARAGVQGHGVAFLGVDALDDVDLTRVGPVGTKHPKGGPHAAAAGGHVRNIRDEESRVVGLVGRDTHRLAALARGFGIDAEVDAVPGVAGEAVVVGRLGAGVGLGAAGWVGLVEEGELLEEVRLVKVVVEDIPALRPGQPGAEEEGGGAQDSFGRRHRDLSPGCSSEGF